jgi:hypothetical protein
MCVSVNRRLIVVPVQILRFRSHSATPGQPRSTRRARVAPGRRTTPVVVCLLEGRPHPTPVDEGRWIVTVVAAARCPRTEMLVIVATGMNTPAEGDHRLHLGLEMTTVLEGVPDLDPGHHRPDTDPGAGVGLPTLTTSRCRRGARIRFQRCRFWSAMSWIGMRLTPLVLSIC